MNLKNMLGAASLNKEDENNLIPLFTPWGENLDSGNVLSEYPRPQMRRKNYTMLNGIWDYRILHEKSSEGVEPGKEFIPDGQILVPFSPESRLSGVERQLQPEGQLWYQRHVVPEHPYLYPLSIDAWQDHVESYFVMRTVDACRDEKGILRFCLNHEPLFLNGVLDQGYWPDGLMTAPSDEALVYDIRLAKSLGFNMIRKHIKVETLRWYYHCDRLGVIVWQDMVNGGSSYNIPLVSYLVNVLPFMGKHIRDNHYRLLSRESREGREEWERECHDTVEHLKSVPSIAVWGPFNEGWGQFDSARITDDIHAQDPTRLIDSASGWFDQGAGDFRSVHNYFRKLKVEKSPDRIFAITEYGGLSWSVKGHASTDSVYGYQKIDSQEKMESRFRELKAAVESLISQGLSAAVYTQLSDIEEEANGLVTYDRKFVKIRPDNRENIR